MKRFSVFLLVVALLAGGTVLSAPSHALSMLPFCGPEHPASRFPEEVSCDAQRHRPRPNPDRHADRHPDVRPQHRPNRPGCSHEQDGRRRNARYVVRGATVLYRGCVVEGASASSFRNLGGGYGCDAWHVFYDGFMMDGAAVLSFKYLGSGYAHDAWSVFYGGRKMADASVPTFRVLGDGYACDAWNTYFRGRRVEDLPLRYRR